MPSTRLLMPQGRRRFTRLRRFLRAAWRDTSALWGEFRTPVLTFGLATIGGGWLYGELLARAGYERPPMVELPYDILRMMVFEPPLATVLNGQQVVPTEPHILAFWYLMPLVALFIIGRGAADFVRLFFDRSGRRTAWEEAVASTYRNHVIVLGVGHVGLRIVRELVGMGFEVVAIDQKAKPELDDELTLLGVPLIQMDGRAPTAMEKAGLAHAQALLVCTSSDQINLEIIMRARSLNPDVRIVARMWDDRFAQHLKQFMGVTAVHSASELAAPVFAGAAVGVEHAQTLRIADVDYSMIRLQVQAGSFLDGGTVGELQHQNDMDIVLHGRGGTVEVQPDNQVRVGAGDTLVIFARHDRVREIVGRNALAARK